MGFLAKLGIQGFLGVLLQLLPAIKAAVHFAEAAHPQQGSGATKFAQAVDSVMTVAGELPAVVEAVQATGTSITDAAHAGDIKRLTDGVGQMVNLAVSIANSVGAFQKSGFVQAVTAQQQSAVAKGGD